MSWLMIGQWAPCFTPSLTRHPWTMPLAFTTMKKGLHRFCIVSLLCQQILLVGFLFWGDRERMGPSLKKRRSCLPNLNELLAFCVCCCEHTKMYPPDRLIIWRWQFFSLEGLIILKFKHGLFERIIHLGDPGYRTKFTTYSMQSNKFKFGRRLLPSFPSSSPPPPPPLPFFPPPQSYFVHILKESQQGVACYMLLYYMGRGLRTVALRAGGALLLVLTSCWNPCCKTQWPCHYR